jgi:hypothetical protein
MKQQQTNNPCQAWHGPSGQRILTNLKPIKDKVATFIAYGGASMEPGTWTVRMRSIDTFALQFPVASLHAVSFFSLNTRIFLSVCGSCIFLPRLAIDHDSASILIRKSIFWCRNSGTAQACASKSQPAVTACACLFAVACRGAALPSGAS